MERLRSGCPDDVLRRLGLRAVAHCFTSSGWGGPLEQHVAEEFRSLDWGKHGAITADGLCLMSGGKIEQTKAEGMERRLEL